MIYDDVPKGMLKLHSPNELIPDEVRDYGRGLICQSNSCTDKGNFFLIGRLQDFKDLRDAIDNKIFLEEDRIKHERILAKIKSGK